MPIEAICSSGRLAPLARLEPIAPQSPGEAGASSSSGFATVLNGLLAGNQQANAAADAAVRDLVSGKAQDLHTVSLAVAQADISFRLMLELRNRLTEAFQEVTRMQV